MSFHKRRLNKENIIRVYDDSGLFGLEKYVSNADAILISDDFSDKVWGYLINDRLNLPEKWDKISQLIIKEKNERRKTTV